jgi:hypothetical protein
MDLLAEVESGIDGKVCITSRIRDRIPGYPNGIGSISHKTISSGLFDAVHSQYLPELNRKELKTT